VLTRRRPPVNESAAANPLTLISQVERTEGRVSLRTRRDRVPEIVALARRGHPCEVPGISARLITDGNPGYLGWIARETAPE
jgi:uncharacterized protein involved in tolerance to divalent cations